MVTIDGNFKAAKGQSNKKIFQQNDVPTGASDKHPVSVCHTMNDHIRQQIQKLVAKNAENHLRLQHQIL